MIKDLLWKSIFNVYQLTLKVKLSVLSEMYRRKLGKIGERSSIFYDNSYLDAPENIFIGDNSFVAQRVKIFTKTGKVYIGNNVTIQNGVILFTKQAEIHIGDNTLINHDTELIANNRNIDIGSDSLIGMGVLMVTSNYGKSLKNIPIKKQRETFAPIKIGKNTWIGGNSMILSGVSIGQGSIVGAGSVVTKSVKDSIVVAGVPAKQINKR